MQIASLPALPHRRKSGGSPPPPRPGRAIACYVRAPVVKLLLISIMIATFLLPVVAAKVQQPRRALFSLLLLMFTVEACYAVFLAVFYLHYAF
jgi:hypothetical protein